MTGHIELCEGAVSGGQYVTGVDFGTLPGRALLVRAGDGAEAGTA